MHPLVVAMAQLCMHLLVVAMAQPVLDTVNQYTQMSVCDSCTHRKL